MSNFRNNLYYHIKPLIPRRAQIFLRRRVALGKLARYAHVWPIDERAATPPAGWPGWPEGKKFAFVLTHDVETAKGVERCIPLAELEKSLGFRSSFNFVAGDYEVPRSLLDDLTREGFEIGVHGLYHDRNLFRSRRVFEEQVPAINQRLREWGAAGFRTPSMYHNLDWLHDLDILYDSSTFDTDPFEPQPDGVGTIFPFWVSNGSGETGYVELPYTLPQDFTLFAVLGHGNIALWKRKLAWIADAGGMANVITHPDYMSFDKGRTGPGEYPAGLYREFLSHVQKNQAGTYWHTLPSGISAFVRDHRGRTSPDTRALEILPRRKPLRACMVAYSFYESDNRVMRYAETLARRGDRVDVIAIGKEGAPPEETIRGVNVYRVQTRVVDEKGKASYLTKLLAFLINSTSFLTRMHGGDPYDLVHVHSVPDFEVFATLFTKMRGAKVILDIHDIVPEFYASKFGVGRDNVAFKALVAAEKASSAFAHHVIISNHIWWERLTRRSVPREKCTVVLNYPDSTIFYPRPRTRDDGKFIMIYPGTYNWHQGLDIAINALAAIRDRAPHAELHIIGRGSERENLKRLVAELGLENRVLFQDSVPMDQIAQFMANADLGIVPKRNDPFGGEAFSTKILEFMTLGVPVVVSRTRIDSYYFNDSVARFFEPENVDDLAGAILDLIEDPEKRTAFSSRALEFVGEFSWDRRKNEYLSLVDRLVNNKS